MLYYVGRTLVAQWSTYRAQPLQTDLRWADLAGSAALVLVTYALLIESWRLMLRRWTGGAAAPTLPFATAMRIWFVSNLGRYVPGKVWQITTMGVMANRAGISPVASTGSALLGTIINIASGIAIVLTLAWRWLDVIDPSARGIAVGLVVLSATGLALLPFIMPSLARFAARVLGRDVAVGHPAPATIALVVLANVLAWALYGLAFMWLVRGVLGSAAGAPWHYIAVFTASYVVGYLFLFLPGGIGPREAVMAALLTSLGLATAKQAWLVAGASRVWLTVLEVTPGLLFLASRARRETTTPSTDATSE